MKRPERDPAWSEEVVEIWRNDLREIWDRDIERHSFHCYHNQLDQYLDLARTLQARSILDVGCAQGTLALMLAERGHEVTAIDIRPEFLNYASSRRESGEIRFIAANIMDQPDLGRFDLVFANQLIEHVIYPAQLLSSLARYVEPSGALVITTPNHDYFRNELPSYSELGDPTPYESLQFTAGGGGHFFAYTEEELKQAAASAGLQVVTVNYFESPWISGHFRVRHLHGVVPLPLLKWADRVALRVAPRRFAHQLLMVLQREQR